MTVRPLLRDLRQILAGFAAFLKYLLTKDLVRVGLGQFSAESTMAVRGRGSRYVVTVSSAAAQTQDVTITLDIYAAATPTHPDGHYAYLSKHLKARPSATTRVEIQYDWNMTASFLIDNSSLPPDDLWRGSLDQPARYSLDASLLDAHRGRLDSLRLYQELTP